jgi:hypothetical protein
MVLIIVLFKPDLGGSTIINSQLSLFKMFRDLSILLLMKVILLQLLAFAFFRASMIAEVLLSIAIIFLRNFEITIENVPTPQYKSAAF